MLLVVAAEFLAPAIRAIEDEPRRFLSLWIVDPICLPATRRDGAHPRTLGAGEDVDVFAGFAFFAHARMFARRRPQRPVRLARSHFPMGRNEIGSRWINPRRGMGQVDGALLP